MYNDYIKIAQKEWEDFCRTGSIASYARYKQALTSCTAKDLEHAFQGQGDHHRGPEIRG